MLSNDDERHEMKVNLTDGKGVMVPIMNEMKLVTDVIVIDTAASA